jgi:hypothetical protein
MLKGGSGAAGAAAGSVLVDDVTDAALNQPLGRRKPARNC